jgi:hypothetical protein
MALLTFLLLSAALGCFVLAALGVAARVNLVAAGLACWVLTLVTKAWPG